MSHFASPDFWNYFNQLPEDIQRIARQNFELLNVNPRHPSLHFKKVGDYWSVRAGRGYRALGTEVEEGILWTWIGTHAEYDTIIG